jgi:hypothetical protein
LTNISFLFFSFAKQWNLREKDVADIDVGKNSRWMTKQEFDEEYGKHASLLWRIALRHVAPTEEDFKKWYGDEHYLKHWNAFGLVHDLVQRTATSVASPPAAGVLASTGSRKRRSVQTVPQSGRNGRRKAVVVSFQPLHMTEERIINILKIHVLSKINEYDAQLHSFERPHYYSDLIVDFFNSYFIDTVDEDDFDEDSSTFSLR